MSQSDSTHEQFTIERRYRQPPARVFAAWGDPVKKRRWFAEVEGFSVDSYELDFRVGGLERTRFRFGKGKPMTNDCFFHAIEPDRRIVTSYAMTLGGALFSASLGTLDVLPDGDGTLLRYTEQVAFFGKTDGIEGRRRGTEDLFGRLAAELDKGE